MSHFGWLLGILAVLWIAWFATGGPEAGRTGKPFLAPLPPVGTGEIYGPEDFVPLSTRESAVTAAEKIPESEKPTGDKTPSAISLFGGQVSFTFNTHINAKTTEPEQEYVEVAAARTNAQPVNITGWTVKSAVTGKSATIGKGTYLPYAGRVNTESPIFLRPGETAVIATGRSPIGVSFRLNTCTGYFAQFQNFYPRLPQECPYQRDEELPAGMTDACIDYVERIGRCTAHVKAIPPEFAGDSVCQEYISREVNYNGCVETHKDDSDFYKGEWRVYLKRSTELWKERRETILLLDHAGKTVDAITY